MSIAKFRWCEEVCRYVRFRPDHEEIRRELLAHIEDSTAELAAAGMTEEAAESAVLTRMGAPKEVGLALNAVHKPLLGWLWRISRWGVILCAVIFVYLLVTASGRLGISLEDLPSVEFQNGERVQGCREFSGGYCFTVKHAAFWENESSRDRAGDVKLCVEVWDLLGSGSFQRPDEFYALDNRGNYYSRHSEVRSYSNQANYVSSDLRGSRVVSDVYVFTVCDVPLDTQWIELRCGEGERQVCLRVELPEGVAE